MTERDALRAAWAAAFVLPPSVRDQAETVLGYAWQALDGAFPPRRLYGYLGPLAAVEARAPALSAVVAACVAALDAALRAEDAAGRPGIRSVPDLGAEGAASRAVSLAEELPRRPGHDDAPWSPPPPAPIPAHGASGACADPWLDPAWAVRLAFDDWALAAGRGPEPDDPFWDAIWRAHGEGTPLQGVPTGPVPGGWRVALDGGPAFLPAPWPGRLGVRAPWTVRAFHPGVGFVVLAPA